MFKSRHYLLVYTQPPAQGSIALCVRWHGPFEETWHPIQMWSRRGQWLRQPYPDPLHKVRDRRLGYNADVWFVNSISPPPQFRWVEIPPEQYAYVSNTPWCFVCEGDHVILRPGHAMNEFRTAAQCVYRDYLRHAHCAYGGMPIYRIRKEFPKRTPADFPELAAAGLFDSWFRETPRPRVVAELSPRTLPVADVMALTASQRHRLEIAPAVVLARDATGLTAKVAGFIQRQGAN